MGVTLSAAGSLKWYNDNFGPSDNISKTYPDKEEYELLNKQAENIPAGSNGLLFLPYLSGERTPYADPYARGVFFGISYMHGQDHFVRSIMEGVAFSQFDCLSLMKEIGIISSKIVLYGGGAKSKIWRQIISDIFGTKIVTLNIEEGPAYGAALIAGAGCGIYKSVEEACDSVIKEVNKNNPIEENVLKYNELYKIYNSLYKNLKDEFKKIDSIS
jgi:xylulokinase